MRTARDRENSSVRARGLRLLPLWLLAFLPFYLFSCSNIDCPVQTAVYTVYHIYNEEGQDTLTDSLSVWTRNSKGEDTLLLNRSVGISSFSLPISYVRPEDTLVFRIGDVGGYETIDTVWVKKDDRPHFESVDCSPSYFHTLTAVRCTHRGIDSIVIHHSEVNYDPSTEHFHIYFAER